MSKSKITVFAKRKQTETGKKFVTYLATIKRKDGTEQTVQIAFDENSCTKPNPENCPMNIEFDKINANMSSKRYTDKNGDDQKSYTLWIKEYQPSIDVYVDHSLDDYDL